MIFLFSLIVIIVLHELGHLFAAKLCKCGVKRFSIGFGKPLFKILFKNTSYEIAPILLGGFCQLRDELSYSRSKYAFTNKTYGQKVFISYAGIVMNVISGLIGAGLYFLTHNNIFIYFAYYSILIGLSNALPVPCLDGSYPIIFLFEKIWGKKKTYRIWGKINSVCFKWIMISNIVALPIFIWLIYTGKIL